MDIASWIAKARALGASDLLLEAQTQIVARIRGELAVIGEEVRNDAVEAAAHALVGEHGWRQFVERFSVDHSLVVAGGRCRINVYRTLRGTALAIRLLGSAVGGLRAANLHPVLGKLVQAKTGLLIISGPTGSGKSTTLASLIEEINQTRACNIITLESPLEYLHANRRSFIRQREIPTHSPSYEQAIVDSLRESPDVLVIGEMRTPDVMRLTLNAAETGHLVLTTMHSSTCAEALTRLCMSFPSDLQGSVRAQVADSLVGVVCQRLDYLRTHNLLVPRCEILTAASGSRGTIRAGQFSQIPTVIQSGGDEGMWTFDRYERWIAQKDDWIVPTVERAMPSVAHEPAHAPVRTPSMPKSRKPPPTAEFDLDIDEDLDLHDIARRIDEGDMKS
jgi:twitching motility protein PilT